VLLLAQQFVTYTFVYLSAPVLLMCRYMATKCDEYWQGDLESALKAHPVLMGTNLAPTPGIAATL
jgi:hypothetical protein